MSLHFDTSRYTSLQEQFLAAKDVVHWKHIENLVQSDLILQRSSCIHHEKTALSISNGIFNLMHHLAKTERLTKRSLSDFIFKENSSLALAEGQGGEQAVPQVLRHCYSKLNLTETDKKTICNAFEKALRQYILDMAFGKSTPECENDTNIDDNEPNWLENRLLDSSLRVLMVSQLKNHTPDRANDNYQLGRVSLEKAKTRFIREIELSVESPLTGTPEEQIAAQRSKTVEYTLQEILKSSFFSQI